jgi:hypothetical protein
MALRGWQAGYEWRMALCGWQGANGVARAAMRRAVRAFRKVSNKAMKFSSQRGIMGGINIDDFF